MYKRQSIERVNVEAEARYAALDAALRAEQEALFGASGDEVFVNTTTCLLYTSRCV